MSHQQLYCVRKSSKHFAAIVWFEIDEDNDKNDTNWNDICQLIASRDKAMRGVTSIILTLVDRVSADITSFMEAINLNTSINDLHIMRGMHIVSSDTWISLFNTLKQTTTMEKFVVEGSFDARGLAALSELMRVNKFIKELYIVGDGPDNDFKMLCDALWADNYTICEAGFPDLDIDAEPFQERIEEFCTRNMKLRWRVVHAAIFNIVLGLFPLQLPVYVLLFIIDSFPWYEQAHTAYKKVSLIESIIASCRKSRAYQEKSRRSLLGLRPRMGIEHCLKK